jgi:peptide/nickel transport system ATP-binding protein
VSRTTPILSVRDLSMHFPLGGGIFGRVRRVVRAVDGVGFDLAAGRTLSLVGESGCGKTTTGRCVLRILRPTAGSIAYRGADGRLQDVMTLPEPALGAYRREVRLVFQDPAASLNPRMSVRDIIAEPLRNAGSHAAAEIEDRTVSLLRRVGLRPEALGRFPHAFSGGERQRIAIARALAPGPRVLVADEALSALDVSVQAQTINLLLELQQEMELAYLFISHDLSVVHHLSDEVAVMYVGRVVEHGPVEQVFSAPRHPYTAALLASAPIADPAQQRSGPRTRLDGEVADPADLPAGCAFAPRCRFAVARCLAERPALRPVGAQQTACHRAEELGPINASCAA